jgi:hypothetical protein
MNTTYFKISGKTKLTGKAYVSPVTTLASSGQTALVEGRLAKSHEKTRRLDRGLRFTRMPETEHSEYPAFSVGANFSPNTAGHIAPKPMQTTASHRGSQS